MHFVVQWVKKIIFWKNGFWQREQQSLGICSCVQVYLNYLCYSYLLDRSQYPGITFYNKTPVSVWLYFQLFSGVARQRRISTGKRLICYLMQLNSICQAILFTCPWRDWGIWKRIRAINVFPEVVLREGTDSCMLEFRTVLLAADHQEGLSYIFLTFLENVSLCPVPGNEFPSHLFTFP